MKRQMMLIALMLGFYVQTATAKVIDFHIITPSEEREMAEAERERQNERDRETVNDETKPEEERREALERLVENEGIV